jgi:macrodomain Ter protein organizer (MatP/YcbG family)
MTTASVPPFSARNRREKVWIEEDFPDSARTGLLHLLNYAVDMDHLSGWPAVARELGRIARAAPRGYNASSVQSIKDARLDAEINLGFLAWDRIYDFCERLHSHLAEDTIHYHNDEAVTITKAQSQLFFAEEMQRLFDEESLGYEFRDGLVQRRGKRHTINQINKAEKALADQRLEAARKHFSKSLRHFRDRKKPDLENTVKEAVCAVEAAAKELFPDAKAATLGDFVKWATGSGLLPKTIGQTLSGLYAFRNSGEGVSHGAASGGVVTAELSEYVLGMAASQIILLADLARGDEEPPF